MWQHMSVVLSTQEAEAGGSIARAYGSSISLGNIREPVQKGKSQHILSHTKMYYLYDSFKEKLWSKMTAFHKHVIYKNNPQANWDVLPSKVICAGLDDWSFTIALGRPPRTLKDS